MNLWDDLEESELPCHLSTFQGRLSRKFNYLFTLKTKAAVILRLALNI
jgi:hypothetical protein